MSAAPTNAADVDEPRFRDALRNLPGRVWIISLGILINRVGNFLPVFIMLYLTERGYSAGAAGLVLGVSGLGNVLGNAVGGYLTDRIGRRSTIVLSAVPTAGLTATVPYLGGLPLIVAVVGLIGVTSQLYRPAAAAVLLDSVTTGRQRLAAFAVFRFAMNVGAALGGVIGGVLASTSYVELFLGNAAACLLFGVVVAGLLRDKPRPGRSDADSDAQTDPADQAVHADHADHADQAGRAGRADQAHQAVGYRQALADRTLVRFLLMTVVAEFIYIQSTVGLPLHVDHIGLSERDFGLLIGLNGLLVLALELPITGLVSRYRPQYVLAVGNVLIGAGLALTGLMSDLALLAATVVIWSFGEMIATSIAHAYLGSLAPPHLVGRYQGLYGAAYTVGTGIGPLLGGALYASASWLLWPFIAGSGLLAGYLSLPRRRTSGRSSRQS